VAEGDGDTAQVTCECVDPAGDDAVVEVSANDTADFDCEQVVEGCLIIIDEDGIDNGMYNIERAAPACGLSMGDNDYLVNDKDWLYDENFYSPSDPLLFPNDLLSECRANDLPYDRKLPTECGNPAFLWNMFVRDGMCGPEDGRGRLVLLNTGRDDDEGYFALPPKHPGYDGIRYADERPRECNKYIYGAGAYDLFIDDFVKGVVPQACLDKVRDVMPLRNQELAKLVDRTCVAVVYDSDINMDYEPIYANLQGERYGLFSFYVEAVEVAGSIPESTSSTSLYDLWLRVLPPQVPGAPTEIVIHDHEPDACEAKARYSSYNGGKLYVKAWSDFPGVDTDPGKDDEDDYTSYMTLSVDGYDGGTDWNVDPFLLEESRTEDVSTDRRRMLIQHRDQVG
jgi:hypothetical protein